MLVADLLSVIDRWAPMHLAQQWDNCGLQVGDPAAEVRSVLAALEITEDVLDEALSGSHDTVITHHPLLFAPLRSLVEGRPKERIVRALVRGEVSVVSCHTNLDAAEGGLSDIAADALGLQDRRPLVPAPAGWSKLVGFIPANAVERVAAAVFAAGAGGIGSYSDCAFATEGTGWFTPGEGATPTVGVIGRPERTVEVRWETVFAKERAGAVVRAFVDAHPYEEPAFDLYALEDVLPGVGLGRVGELETGTTVRRLAQAVGELFDSRPITWSGAGDRIVRRIGVLPGSGRGSVPTAAGQCEVLVSGDFSYHDCEAAAEGGLELIDVPHGDFEWWAFRSWCGLLAEHLSASGVEMRQSKTWRSPWRGAAD